MNFLAAAAGARFVAAHFRFAASDEEVQWRLVEASRQPIGVDLLCAGCNGTLKLLNLIIRKIVCLPPHHSNEGKDGVQQNGYFVTAGLPLIVGQQCVSVASLLMVGLDQGEKLSGAGLPGVVICELAATAPFDL